MLAGFMRLFALFLVIATLQGCASIHTHDTDTPPDMAPASYRPELVELVKLDPSIRLDIKYAGNDNFIGRKVYPEARAFLLRPAAEALVAASAELKQHGFGIIVFDAYRPWNVTLLFWELTPPEKRPFVAIPREGSVHNRGYAVDLTLYDLKTGKEVTMPSAFDEMNEKAFPSYSGGTEISRKHRDLLRSVMESKGFSVHPNEWWHFNFAGWETLPVMNISFNEIPPANP